MKMNKKKFAAALFGLASIFDKELSEPLVVAYRDALADLTDEDIKTAFNRAAKECRFFPRPVELRELASHDMTTVEDKAHLAFNIVRRAAKQVSPSHSVTFPPPINGVLEDIIEPSRWCSRWEHVCSVFTSEPEALRFVKNEFVKAYIARVRSGYMSGPEHITGGDERYAIARGKEWTGAVKNISELLEVPRALLAVNQKTKELTDGGMKDDER